MSSRPDSQIHSALRYAFTPPVPITPVLGAFADAPLEPPSDPDARQPYPGEEMVPLTFWLDGHPIVSRWFGYGTYLELRASSYFQEPVCLCLYIDRAVAASHHLVRVEVAAFPSATSQARELFQFRALPEVVWGGQGRIGLLLGHRWARLPREMFAPVFDDATLLEYERLANEVADRILFGTDDELARRLFESIPGIQGEVVEGDSLG